MDSDVVTAEILRPKP